MRCLPLLITDRQKQLVHLNEKELEGLALFVFKTIHLFDSTKRLTLGPYQLLLLFQRAQLTSFSIEVHHFVSIFKSTI